LNTFPFLYLLFFGVILPLVLTRNSVTGEAMNRTLRSLWTAFFAITSPLWLSVSNAIAEPADNPGLLLVANQKDHTLLLIDLASNRTVFTAGVDINGHEVVASPDARFAYVPIYGNSGVGKPGTDGSTIHVVDLQIGRVVSIINMGKPVRPHCAKFGPDGMLYVSSELTNSLDVVDPHSGKIVAQIPTGLPESHMFVITPDGNRAYTSNVGSGTVSVLDLRKRTLLTTIPVSKSVQRISVSPDGRYIYTHDQSQPRIAVIDTSSNQVSGWIDLPSLAYSSAVTSDGRWLIANASSGKIFVVNTATRKVDKSFDIPKAVGEVLISPDNAHAYVSTPQSGTIEILDLLNWKLQDPIHLTQGVDGLAWIPAVPK
jgi:YVTN family beta-propeller protein